MPFVSVSRSTALVGLSVLIAVLVIAGQRLAGAGAASAPEVAAPLEPVSAPVSSQRFVVHVVGAVRRPGLYRLREGARVADAVARAGGATRRANLTGLNLAAPLVDGTQVLVPARVAVGVGAVVPPVGEGSDAASSGVDALPAQKLSLSNATAEQLDELPGVGPITAQKILDYRAEHGLFRSVDDLDAVPGIGPTRIEQLRDLVTP
ncbi:MAG: ComEA family DNA-binding protein [Actinobacteria bacterium]|nr:ComEA family DNA-binding protein [Actinomycetota bacterium]